MSIYESETWINDLDEVVSSLPELSRLDNHRILITGASGLICSAVVDVIIRFNELHKKSIQLILAGRNRDRLVSRFGQYSRRKYIQIVEYDATKSDNVLDYSCDYIIHGASNAFPRLITQEPVETMLGNIMGIKYLLEYARDNHVKRVAYISSSEVYGQKDDMQPYKEEDYGYIDILNPRNAYSIGKRAAEALCVSYYDEYNVSSSIIRPGHIYGPTATESDNRVSSLWAYAAARGEDIVMKSRGLQLRSYCYCLDCASAILTVLLKGENCSSYNISNPASIITIKEMAELMSSYGKVNLVIDEPSMEEVKAFNPMSNSSLNSDKLSALDWKGLFSAERGFEHTISILKQII